MLSETSVETKGPVNWILSRCLHSNSSSLICFSTEMERAKLNVCHSAQTENERWGEVCVFACVCAWVRVCVCVKEFHPAGTKGKCFPQMSFRLMCHLIVPHSLSLPPLSPLSLTLASSLFSSPSSIVSPSSLLSSPVSTSTAISYLTTDVLLPVAPDNLYSVCETVCARKRERDSVSLSVTLCTCVRERQWICVCVWACTRERERQCLCLCACVCERDRVYKREALCVCVFVFVHKTSVR